MQNEIRFLADEHIDLPAIKSLRARGTDIISLKEANLRGFPDDEILLFANKENRVIVTRDKDFLRLASSGTRHKGIIFLTKSLDTSNLIRELEKITILYKPQDVENSIFYIPLKQ